MSCSPPCTYIVQLRYVIPRVHSAALKVKVVNAAQRLMIFKSSLLPLSTDWSSRLLNKLNRPHYFQNWQIVRILITVCITCICSLHSCTGWLTDGVTSLRRSKYLPVHSTTEIWTNSELIYGNFFIPPHFVTLFAATAVHRTLHSSRGGYTLPDLVINIIIIPARSCISCIARSVVVWTAIDWTEDERYPQRGLAWLARDDGRLWNLHKWLIVIFVSE